MDLTAKSPAMAGDYYNWDPDAIYVRGSVTFIYDPKIGSLYTSPYPTTHTVMLLRDGKDLGRKLGLPLDLPPRKVKSADGETHMVERPDRIDGEAAGYVMGRFLKNAPPNGRTLIGVWNEDINQSTLKGMAQILVRKFPDLAADSKNTYILSRHDIAFPPTKLADLGIKSTGQLSQTSVEDNEKCGKAATLNVPGGVLTLAQVLSALHATRGDQINQIRNSFCAQADTLRQRLGDECPDHSKMLKYAYDRIGCGRDDYRRALDAGRQAYRQELRNLFRNPEQLSAHFRTQKELDAAWDELQRGKREQAEGFRAWLDGQPGPGLPNDGLARRVHVEDPTVNE